VKAYSAFQIFRDQI